MDYYKLQPSTVINEIGVYPQCTNTLKLGFLSDFVSGSEQGILKDIDSLPEPIIEEKARPTTYLDVVAISNAKFLVFHKAFISFLKNYEVLKYQDWNIDVYHKKNLISDYKLFYAVEGLQSKLIDYKNSVFYVGKLADWTFRGKNLQINNYQEYLNIQEVLRPEKLIIKSDKLILDFSRNTYDLFRINHVPFMAGYFVSSKLKTAIEESEYTGFSFQQIEAMDDRITVK